MIINQDSLLAFKQFGFREGGAASGGHVRGTCPFCGKENHFYVNATNDNKTWDCKKCGRAGGFQKFLQEAVKFAKGKNLSALSKNRGIGERTLYEMDIGFINGLWCIPVYDSTKTKVLNVKIYDGSSFKNTASCSATMYGLWCLPKDYNKIYLTEGEWDYLALKDSGGEAVLGAPGAGTFKTDSVPLFLGKRVYILYDNDEAGKRGMEKVSNFLLSVASEVSTIQWPQGTPEGYDIRDVYKKKGADTLQYIESICHRVQVNRGGLVYDNINLTPLNSIQEAYNVFHKWLHLQGDELLDVIFGTILANRLQGDPVWMFLVAPPGGTKSEPLLTLTNCAGIETLSSMTPATLISGYSLGGNDPSLIPLLDNKTLVIKDFTVIMGLPAAEREEIMSILRDAYDGECKRIFANGVTRRYKSKFGIIAGVTPAIETFADENTRLGERFLRWRNWIPLDFTLRRKYIERALENISHENEMRAELSSAAKRILLADYSQRVPKLNSQTNGVFVCIADWVATMRGVIVRDKYRRNALYKPSPELGTRICKELIKLFMGIGMLHGKTDNNCLNAIKNVAKSSVNARFLDIVSSMWKGGKDKVYTTMDLQKASGLPLETTNILLDDLLLLKVVIKSPDGRFWQFNKNFKQLTVECKIFD